MKEKIKIIKSNVWLRSLKDVRNLGTIAFLAIALLVTWSSVKVVQTNYELQKEMSAIDQQNEVQKLKNSNLKLKNEYYRTDAYLELAARKHFNKALPGETLIIIPKNIALSKTIELKSLEDVEATVVNSNENSYRRNFNAWLDFLFHRNSD